MSEQGKEGNFHPNIQSVPAASLAEWANKHALENDAAKDALQLFLARRPELANHPLMLQQLGATAARGQIIEDLRGMVEGNLAEQTGGIDAELAELLASFGPDGPDSTPQA